MCKPVGLNDLVGSTVSLRRAAPDAVDFIHAAILNDGFMDLYRLGQDRGITKAQLRDKLHAEQGALPQHLKRIEWVIIKTITAQQMPIGLAALVDYQPPHQRAEFLFGIVDPQERNASRVIEAALLVLDFAFNQLGLHKITSFVYGNNVVAQKNTVHLGFTQEGFFRQHLFTGHSFVDVYQNGLLKTDFISNPRLAKLSKFLLGRDITRPIGITCTELDADLLQQLQTALAIPDE